MTFGRFPLRMLCATGNFPRQFLREFRALNLVGMESEFNSMFMLQKSLVVAIKVFRSRLNIFREEQAGSVDFIEKFLQFSLAHLDEFLADVNLHVWVNAEIIRIIGAMDQGIERKAVGRHKAQ